MHFEENIANYVCFGFEETFSHRNPMKLHISLKYKKNRTDTKKSWYQQRPSFPRTKKPETPIRSCERSYELVSNFTCISEIGKAQEPKSH